MSAATTKPGWKDVAEAAVLREAGNAQDYETGDWRTYRPTFIPERCIQCMFCWLFCPDTAIIVENGRVVGIDYKHCKGCGICAKECPAKGKALHMHNEDEFVE